MYVMNSATVSKLIRATVYTFFIFGWWACILIVIKHTWQPRPSWKKFRGLKFNYYFCLVKRTESRDIVVWRKSCPSVRSLSTRVWLDWISHNLSWTKYLFQSEIKMEISLLTFTTTPLANSESQVDKTQLPIYWDVEMRNITSSVMDHCLKGIMFKVIILLKK